VDRGHSRAPQRRLEVADGVIMLYEILPPVMTYPRADETIVAIDSSIRRTLSMSGRHC
jgi:hypothetical protein